MLGWFVCPTVSMVTINHATGLEKTLLLEIIIHVSIGVTDGCNHTSIFFNFLFLHLFLLNHHLGISPVLPDEVHVFCMRNNITHTCVLYYQDSNPGAE